MYPLLLILNYALLALTFVIGKQVVALAHPLIIISLRMIFGGFLLLALIALQNPKKLCMGKGEGPLFLKVALFHIYLAFLPEFWALQHLPSSHVNLIYSFTPLCSAALSYLINGETLSQTKIIALVLGLIGLAPSFFQNAAAHTASSQVHLMAEMALLIAVISSTYAWFDIAKLMKTHSILLINGVSMLLGGFGALITACLLLKPSDFCISHPLSLTLHIAALIILSNFLFYNIFGSLLRHYSLNLLSFAGLLSPFFGAIWGKVLLGEQIDGQFLFAMISLFLALAIFFRDEQRGKKGAVKSLDLSSDKTFNSK